MNHEIGKITDRESIDLYALIIFWIISTVQLRDSLNREFLWWWSSFWWTLNSWNLVTLSLMLFQKLTLASTTMSRWYNSCNEQFNLWFKTHFLNFLEIICLLINYSYSCSTAAYVMCCSLLISSQTLLSNRLPLKPRTGKKRGASNAGAFSTTLDANLWQDLSSDELQVRTDFLRAHWLFT